ncbi:hypothetical protein [Pseudonocardia sp. HH130630-07]|uniref:hypothetical protein n=1 Tax=Pseudonocardia sp. HH130630-07 TaxID=1690815 RepID=UPI000814E09F|nr:hypothetical protein [Pseudonocardia sp. HH130630-07]ANY06999.1 hypothetical protein AFB00_12625 [Pseudonocardia sp. HH130630-07]
MPRARRTPAANSGNTSSRTSATSRTCEVPRSRKIPTEPLEMIIVWRSVSSAIGPRTSAMTRAAGDMPTRRMKKPSTPQASMTPTSMIEPFTV